MFADTIGPCKDSCMSLPVKDALCPSGILERRGEALWRLVLSVCYVPPSRDSRSVAAGQPVGVGGGAALCLRMQMEFVRVLILSREGDTVQKFSPPSECALFRQFEREGAKGDPTWGGNGAKCASIELHA